MPTILLDNQLKSLQRNKGMALIAYLLVSGEFHRRDTLANLFWSDYSAKHALRTTLSEITSTLGTSALHINRQTIGFRRDLVWADVWEFDAVYRSVREHQHPSDQPCTTCLSQLAYAVELYRGDFLAGLSLRDSQEFDDWQLYWSENLRSHYVDMLRLLIDQYKLQSNLRSALNYARKWKLAEPLQEEAYQYLMEIYVQSGHVAAALREYQEYEQIIQQELGVAPSQVLADLYQAIKLPQPQVVVLPETMPEEAMPTHNLPEPLTPFVGRGKEIQQLIDMLDLPVCRLITLIGIGGVGKTRLALHVGQLCLETRRFDHVIQVQSKIAIDSDDELAALIAHETNMPFQTRQPIKTLLANYLRSKSVLLLIDNLENCLKGTSLLVELLSQTPRLKIVVTSRILPKIPGEWIVEISGLTHQPNSSELSDAVQLFIQGARRAVPGFKLLDLESVETICRRLYGFPLSIEVAAYQLRIFSCAEVANIVATELDQLFGLPSDESPFIQSLYVIFDQIWKTLNDNQKAAFARLAIFEHDFDYNASAAIAGSSFSTLIALADRCLLTRTGDGRYQMQGVIQHYASRHLHEFRLFEETAFVRNGYFVGWLKGLVNPETRLISEANLALIDTEILNIRAMWQSLLTLKNYADLEQIIDPVYQFYEMRNYYTEGKAVFVQAVAVFRAQNLQLDAPLLFSRLLVRSGIFLLNTRAVEPAFEVFQEALHYAEQENSLVDQVFALNYLGVALIRKKDVHAAQDCLERSLQIAAALGQNVSLGRVLNNLGIVFTILNDLDQAESYTQRALDLCRKLNNLRGEAAALNGLGNIAFENQRYERAEDFLRQSMDIKTYIGDRWGYACSLISLGEADLKLEKYVEAQASFQTALTICEDLGFQAGVDELNAYLSDLKATGKAIYK